MNSKHLRQKIWYLFVSQAFLWIPQYHLLKFVIYADDGDPMLQKVLCILKSRGGSFSGHYGAICSPLSQFIMRCLWLDIHFQMYKDDTLIYQTE